MKTFRGGEIPFNPYIFHNIPIPLVRILTDDNNLTLLDNNSDALTDNG